MFFFSLTLVSLCSKLLMTFGKDVVFMMLTLLVCNISINCFIGAAVIKNLNFSVLNVVEGVNNKVLSLQISTKYSCVQDFALQ